MYDATGVRLQAGLQAEVIFSALLPSSHSNILADLLVFFSHCVLLVDIVQVLNQIVYELPAEHPLAESRPLRELLGHTPPQVGGPLTRFIIF